MSYLKIGNFILLEINECDNRKVRNSRVTNRVTKLIVMHDLTFVSEFQILDLLKNFLLISN